MRSYDDWKCHDPRDDEPLDPCERDRDEDWPEEPCVDCSKLDACEDECPLYLQWERDVRTLERKLEQARRGDDRF